MPCERGSGWDRGKGVRRELEVREGRSRGQDRPSLKRIHKPASDPAGGTATTRRFDLPLRDAAVRWGKRVGRLLRLAGVPKTLFF